MTVKFRVVAVLLLTFTASAVKTLVYWLIATVVPLPPLLYCCVLVVSAVVVVVVVVVVVSALVAISASQEESSTADLSQSTFWHLPMRLAVLVQTQM